LLWFCRLSLSREGCYRNEQGPSLAITRTEPRRTKTKGRTEEGGDETADAGPSDFTVLIIALARQPHFLHVTPKNQEMQKILKPLMDSERDSLAVVRHALAQRVAATTTTKSLRRGGRGLRPLRVRPDRLQVDPIWVDDWRWRLL